MRDFTLEVYKTYLQAIRTSYANILRFDEFFRAESMPERFCLIRHDVDRKPQRALQMAQVENESGIQATYYFRAKPHVFAPEIIKNIETLGHEIGYHYESLSDAKGNLSLALKQFEKNLAEFQKITAIQTISMHGRPFSPYDDRDIWRDQTNHRLLSEAIKRITAFFQKNMVFSVRYIWILIIRTSHTSTTPAETGFRPNPTKETKSTPAYNPTLKMGSR
jgi:hypothetical protein